MTEDNEKPVKPRLIIILLCLSVLACLLACLLFYLDEKSNTVSARILSDPPEMQIKASWKMEV